MLTPEEEKEFKRLQVKERLGADISAALEDLERFIKHRNLTFREDVSKAVHVNRLKKEFGEKLNSLCEDAVVIESTKDTISKEVIPSYKKERPAQVLALKELNQDPLEKLEAEIDIIKLRVSGFKNLYVVSEAGTRFKLSNQYKNIFTKSPRRILEKIDIQTRSMRKEAEEKRTKAENKTKALEFFRMNYPDADSIEYENVYRTTRFSREGFYQEVIYVKMNEIVFTFGYQFPTSEEGIKIFLHEVSENIKGALFTKHGLDIVYKLPEIIR